MEKMALVRRKKVAVAVSLAMVQVAAAHAQQAAADGKDALGLETVVVTATTTGGSKMKQSLSVSTLDSEQILKTVPTNSAEVLRAIPGVRSESSGGEGNANITVRGLPISAGGARYVQMQQDGLPILQFGDIAFGTADQFMRIDSGLERVEVVRGGSASTTATNSPGGVVNFISKTGDEKGGMIGYTRGLTFDQNRLDFNYGSPIDDKTRFFVSGYFREGESPRPAGVTGESGGQIRGNLTREFDNGYLRASFSHLDDKVPMNMPVPTTLSGGSIQTVPGIDPRKASFYSPNWVADKAIDRNGNAIDTNVNDGLHVKSDSFGLEGSYKLGNGWSVTDRFRTSENSGRWIGLFPADNGYTGSGPFTYATGSNAGRAYNGRVLTMTVFNVGIDDLGNTLNDLKVSKAFTFPDFGKLTTAAGLYYSKQNVGMTWNFNQYLMEATGSSPALIASPDTNASGQLAQGSAVWGGCCTRRIDAQYTTISPYLAAALESGRWNIDASVRRDNQSASGHFNQAVNNQFLAANNRKIDYDVDRTAYSVGANYTVNSQLALFARNSLGYAFNADRIMFNGPLDGSVAIPVNKVEQTEAGVKWKEGKFSSFVTFFDAKTTETNFEATTQRFTSRVYDAKGVEVEAAYSMGRFRIAGGLTYTDSKIAQAEDASIIGKKPRRQADLTYQIMPSYTLGQLNFGAAFIGTTASWGDDANSIKMPAYVITNAFANYQIDNHWSANVSVNNLFNKLAWTEVEGDGHAARALNGRSAIASIRYNF